MSKIFFSLFKGRKGIGFKSVFNVTDAPEVHSNGFHLRFHRQSRESTRDPSSTSTGSLSLLIPEWCDSEHPESTGHQPTRWPLPCPVPAWCTTLFVLPLTAKSNAPGLQLSSVIQLTRETLVPSVMLFLRRLRCLTFSCSSESTTTDRPVSCTVPKNVHLFTCGSYQRKTWFTVSSWSYGHSVPSNSGSSMFLPEAPFHCRARFVAMPICLSLSLQA